MALGLFVVQDRFPRIPLRQLGVTQHPPARILLELLEETPPLDGETASKWFGIMDDQIASVF